jgi:cell division protein ZapB
LTIASSRPTINTMKDTNEKISRLEGQVDELLNTCKRLDDENKELQAQLAHMRGERATLLELKEQARVQVEAMIMRLKSMENA